MTLEIFWFCLIAVLWGGYFLLEGFDFGVGMLLPLVGRDEDERGTMLKTIGPVWDGNEVWLVVAAGATFAAFPVWYATMFSGLYEALLLVLVLLIVRAVSFEWRERSPTPRWRARWAWATTAASVGAPFLWGVGLANLVHGLPLDSGGDFTGDFLDLFSAYTVLAGLSTVVLFALHGATFLTLRTSGELCERAAAAARRLCVPAAVVVAAFAAATVAVAVDRNDKDIFPPVLPATLAVAAVVLAIVFVLRRRSGRAFVATGLGALLWVATVFTALYPRVLVSSSDFGNSLTLSNAASGHYALSVITVVAAIFTPVILLYQAWSYHVFRARLTPESAQPAPGAASGAAGPATSSRAGVP
jgi:cytochrome bd ubiquinol oxidase subunit II